MVTVEEVLPSELTQSIKRLLDENEGIKDHVSMVERYVEQLQKQAMPPDIDHIFKLKCFTDSLAKSFESHERWEAKILPRIMEVVAGKGNPYMKSSLKMLEAGNQGEPYFRLYWEQISAYLELRSPELFNKGLKYLLHACRLVRDQLELEEDVLRPLI